MYLKTNLRSTPGNRTPTFITVRVISAKLLICNNNAIVDDVQRCRHELPADGESTEYNRRHDLSTWVHGTRDIAAHCAYARRSEDKNVHRECDANHS